MKARITRPLVLVAALAATLASCASAPKAAQSPKAGQAATEPTAQVDAREVLWDPAVKADFEKDVPKFVRAIAKSKMEDMAREKGTYLVDRALYEEAMATYKR
jgi:hypothetical protein